MLQDARFRIQEEDADYGMQYDTRYRIQNIPEQCWIHLRDGNISTQDKMQNI